LTLLQTLTVTTEVTDTTTVTATNSSVSTSSAETFDIAVGYSITNETTCLPDPAIRCTWSGTIAWPTSTCNYAYACVGFDINPQQDNKSYSVTLGECGAAVNWDLSMSSPASDTQLSITIINSQGAIVYQTATTPDSQTLSGSYSRC
jgi:hypothetical protein